MDVARFNLSHGSYATTKRSTAVRAASDDTGRAVGILVDLQGPKIRTTRFSGGPVDWSPAIRFTITTREVDGTQQRSARPTRGWPVTSAPATPC
jgi:pyruvate kinase